MYICDHCGAQFEGKICPKCRTMRSAAAVISESRRGVRQRNFAQAQSTEPPKKHPSTCDELRAVGWTRKAPAMRLLQKQEEDVVVTDALRSLKIASSRPKTAQASAQLQQQETEMAPNAPNPPEQAVQRKGVSRWVTGTSKVPSVPRKGAGAETASNKDNSRRIDAAWKLFAAGKKEDSN